MPVWGWVVLALTVVASVAIVWFSRTGLAAKLHAKDQELAQERGRAERLAGDAARLPDAQERARIAEVRAAGLEADLREALTKVATLAARWDDATREAATANGKLDVAQIDLEQARSELFATSANLAKAIAERDSAFSLARESKALLENAQTAMRTVFVEAASSVFDEKAAVLDRKINETGEHTKQQLESTLKPFSEQVFGFQTKVEQFTTAHMRDAENLQGAIGKLQQLNSEMASATDGLTKALKGNAKVRGDWGEMILETVLKASGLQDGITYRKQVSATDEETGQRRQPDVIVDMPDGRQVVIDSKVNLIAWADYHSAQTPEDAQDALIRHAAALRTHVRDLAERNYPKVMGSHALDLTVLFVPIEGALAAALELDPTLQNEALGKRIAFASPNTLMALLKVVDRLWVRDRVQKQAEDIRKGADAIIDSVTVFLGDFAAIEDRLKAVDKAYITAKDHLTEGRFSVLNTAKRLIKAGVRGKKALPEVLELDDDLLSTTDNPALPLIEESA